MSELVRGCFFLEWKGWDWGGYIIFILILVYIDVCTMYDFVSLLRVEKSIYSKTSCVQLSESIHGYLL